MLAEYLLWAALFELVELGNLQSVPYRATFPFIPHLYFTNQHHPGLSAYGKRLARSTSYIPSCSMIACLLQDDMLWER